MLASRTARRALSTSSFFPDVKPIKYEGADSLNPLSFKHYNADEVVEGKKMKDWLRFSVTYVDGDREVEKLNEHLLAQFLQLLSVRCSDWAIVSLGPIAGIGTHFEAPARTPLALQHL